MADGPLLRALVSGSCSEAGVEFAGAATTFGNLLDAARALDLPPAGRVALIAEPSLDLVTTMVAALLRGVTVVPVPADIGERELAHVLSDSGATPVGALAERAPDRVLDKDPVGALMLYTSGTTGAPKGVPLSAAAITSCLDGLADAWDWTPNDTLVHGLPLNHVHGLVLGVLGALHVGSGLVHTGRPTPTAYAAGAASGGTLFFGVPTVWGRVAADEESARALASARLLVSGSAPLPVPLFERLRELTSHEVVERYGMTETLITLSGRAGAEQRPGWVGWPLHGIRTRLRSEAGGEVPHDGESIGRLHVQGASVTEGYLDRPEANAASFTEDGWFVTGDIAAISPDGCHRIVGRESVDLIKTGGYRVGAGEVEAELLAHPDVAEAAVVGEPDEDLGQRIVAYVVAREGAVIDGPALSDWIAGRLSVHKRPRWVHVRESLPRNHMGKVIKPDLR